MYDRAYLVWIRRQVKMKAVYIFFKKNDKTMIAVISNVNLFDYSEKNTKNRNDQQHLVNLSSCHQLKWYLPAALRVNFIVSNE